MSHSQFHSIKLLILRHAWLNLWDKHMTTGRINQVTIVRIGSRAFTLRFQHSRFFPEWKKRRVFTTSPLSFWKRSMYNTKRAQKCTLVLEPCFAHSSKTFSQRNVLPKTQCSALSSVRSFIAPRYRCHHFSISSVSTGQNSIRKISPPKHCFIVSDFGANS